MAFLALHDADAKYKQYKAGIIGLRVWSVLPYWWFIVDSGFLKQLITSPWKKVTKIASGIFIAK